MDIARRFTLSLSVFTASAALGQSSASQPSALGRVTGHVICTDTHLQAKFAQVILIGVPSRHIAVDSKVSVATPEKAVLEQMNMVRSQSELDGSYSIDKVPAGDYYVFAWSPGYRQPFGMVKQALQSNPENYDSLPGISKVHVSNNESVSADLSLQKGGAVTGRVIWSDGTPLARATVTLESVKKLSQSIPAPFLLLNNPSMGAGSQLVTDDLGRYRIVGVPPGDYFVKVSFQPRTQVAITGGVIDAVQHKSADSIVVYAPNTFYVSAAATVTIADNEEHSDLDISFDLNGLHTVRGQVVSAEDHHHLNGGLIVLEDQSHKDFRKTAQVNSDGTFSIEFVPQGSYALLVSSAADNVSTKNVNVGLLSFASERATTTYKGTRIAVTVLDADLDIPPVEVVPSNSRGASNKP